MSPDEYSEVWLTLTVVVHKHLRFHGWSVADDLGTLVMRGNGFCSGAHREVSIICLM